MDKEHWPQNSSQIWFHAARLEAVLLGGDKHTFGFWLPLGDQNECCIGSVTETLKAMEAVLNYMTPALNARLPALYQKAGSQQSTFYNFNL